MVKIRSFTARDIGAFLQLWTQKSNASPEHYHYLDRVLFLNGIASQIGFEPSALFLAFDEERVVGQIHAVPGISADRNRISFETSAIYPPLIDNEYQNSEELSKLLLETAENYCRQQGALRIFAGGNGCQFPMYHGFYGGSFASGIFENHSDQIRLFETAGYKTVRRDVRMSLNLKDFKPETNIRTITLSRLNRIQLTEQPIPKSDWLGSLCFRCQNVYNWALIDNVDDQIKCLFQVHQIRVRKNPMITYITLPPQEKTADDSKSSSTETPQKKSTIEPEICTEIWEGVGIDYIIFRPELRTKGYDTFLIGDVLTQLHSQNPQIKTVEVTVPEQNTAERNYWGLFGFNFVENMLIMQKELT